MQIASLNSNLNIGGATGSIQVPQITKDTDLSKIKFKNVSELQSALMQKYDFYPSSKMSGISESIQISPKLLQKAIKDPKTLKWLDENLAAEPQAARYIASRSNATHRVAFYNDEGDISSMSWGPAKKSEGAKISPSEELQKLLEKLKEKREKAAEEEAKLEKIRDEKAAREEALKTSDDDFIEVRGETSEQVAKNFAQEFANLASENTLLNLKV